MRKRTWRVLDWGDVPKDAQRTVERTCACGYTAEFPVLGLPIAELQGGAIIFDVGPQATPTTIQCRRCGRVLTTAPIEEVG